MGVVEWWRPFGTLVTQDFYCMRVGHARAAVETAVDVPDHGDALSPDREETIMTIQFER